LKFLFWKRKNENKKRLIIFLGKRGQRRLLGSLELGEKDDIALEISKFLDEKVKELNINVAEYPSVILLTENNQTIKLENPFYQESEDTEENTKNESEKSSSNLDVTEAIKVALQMQSRIYDSMLEGISEGIKHVVSNSMQITTDLLKAQQQLLQQQLLQPQQTKSKFDIDDLMGMLLLGGLRNVQQKPTKD
jgi:hypothetical protein